LLEEVRELVHTGCTLGPGELAPLARLEGIGGGLDGVVDILGSGDVDTSDDERFVVGVVDVESLSGLGRDILRRRLS
jgi:hypothetical protein